MNKSTPAASGKPQILSVSPTPSDVEYHLSSLTDSHRIVSPAEFETALHERHWDVIVCDFNTASAHDVMALVKANAPDTPVIFVAESPTVPDVVAMMRLGARGFVDKADPEQLVVSVKQELADRNTLNDERNFHSEILRNMAEGVHIVRASDGIIVFANRTMERLFGYAPGEVVGQHVSRLHDPAAGDPQSITNHIIQMLREKGTWSGELRRIRKDGTPFWSSNHIITYDHAEYGLVWIAVQQDITAQKQAQDALRVSEERYRHIVDTQSEWVCRYDADLRLKYGNAAYCRAFGTVPEALVGQSILEKIPAEKHEQIWAYIRSITPENPVAVSIHPTILQDGSLRWTEWKDRAILDEQGQIIEYQGVGRDITEQRLAEEALRKSQDLFQRFMTHLPAVMYINDDQGRLTYCNPQYAESLDLPMEAIQGKTLAEYVGDDIARVAAAENEQVLARNGACEFDSYSAKAQQHWHIIKFPLPQPDSAPYIACIGINVTDQRQAEQALRASEERYRRIIEDQSEYVCRYDANLRMTFGNRAYCEAYGFLPDEVMGRSILDLVPPEFHSRLWDYLGTLTPDTPTGFSVHPSRQGDGTMRWVEWKDRAILDEQGQIIEYQGVGRDITAQKQAQEALRESEMRLRTLINSQTNFVLRTDLEGKLSYWNEIFAREWGWVYEVEGLQGGYSLKSVAEHHHQRVGAVVEQCLMQPGTVFKVELDKPTRDGGFRTTLWEFVCLTNAEGVPTEIQCMGIDISERIRAERALRESEERFRFLFKNHPHPMWVYDRETLAFLEVNDAAIDHYGYSRDEFLAMRLPDIRPTEDVERLLNDAQRVRPDLQYSGEWRHTLKNGRVIPVEITSHTLEFAGRPAALVVAQDITERKNAQAALEAAHALLEQRVIERTNELERAKNRIEAVFNHSGDGILLVDLDFGIQQGNYAFEKMFGVPPDSYVGWTLGTLFEAEDATIIDYMVQEVATTHQTRHVEARVQRPDDQPAEVEISIAPVNRSENKVVNLVCIMRDITERKQAQAALQKYAAEVHDLYNFAPAGYHSLDRDGVFVRINNTELQWLGYTEPEVVGKLKLADLLSPASRHTFYDNFPRFMAQGRISDLEVEMVRKDGSTFIGLISATAVMDENGQFLHSRSTLMDITELKHAQRAIAEERNLLRAVIDTVPDFIYVKDTQHRYLLNNVAHARTLGITSPAEAVGKTDFELFPPELAAKYHADEDRIFATGKPLIKTEERSRGQDGQEIWALTTKLPLRNLDGAVIGLVGTTHDISHLKASEEALRRSQADLRSILDSTSTAFMLLDRDGVVRLVNVLAGQAAVSVFGTSLGVGQHATKYIPPMFHPRFQESFADALQGTTSTVILSSTVDDMPSSHEFRYYPVRAGDGEIIGVTIAMDDITERKAAEQQLRYLASLQEHMYDAVIGTDLDFRIQSWNAAAERIYGWTAVEAIGKDASVILRTASVTGQPVHEIRQLLTDSGHWNGEIVHYHRDGSPLHILESMAMMRDENGHPAGIIVVAHNITARKLAEQELERKYQHEREMQGYLTALHEISLHLTRAETLDEFYHLVVQEGLAQFGFERMGLLLYDADDGSVTGTYGTDAEGQLVAEHHLRMEPSSLTDILKRSMESHERFRFEQETTLYAYFKPIDWGQNAVAALWNGQVLGWLAIDNGVHHQPITQAQLDILALYAMTVGSLMARKRAEIALRESEERYRFLAENVQEVILRFSPDLIRTYATPSTYAMLGHLPEELIGQPMFFLMHPDDVATTRSKLQHALSTHAVSFTVICRVQHKAGHYVWVEVNTTIVRDFETGRVMEFISLIHDITERKQAEDALRESEARYRLVAENIHDVIIKATPDGLRTFATPSVVTLMGYTPDELIGLSRYDHIHPDDCPHSIAQMNQALDAKSAFFTLIQRIRHKAGHYVWTESINTIVYDPLTGEPVEILGVVRNITERKQAEDALRESEQRFRMFIEAAPLAAIVSDHDGKIVLVNEAGAQLLGYGRNELVGQPIEVLVPDEARPNHPKCDALFEALKPIHHQQVLELRAQRKDGTTFPVEIQLSQIETQPAPMVMSLIIDLTERKEAELALKQALAHEKELGDLKSRFVSMASHEFRTPLAAIMATTETLTLYRDKMNPAQIDARLEKIRQQINHMKDIMEEVLELARIQAGHAEFKPSMSHFDALCEEIIEEFDSQAGYRGRMVYTCDQPPIEAFFDRRLARQIISNLVSNALKYSPETKPVHIQLRNEAHQLVLTVADEGIGIPPEDLKHLFEPFHRASNVGTISGTGLGLSITKQAVDLHGGTIIPASVEGRGTTFTVTLPKLDQGKVGHGEDSRH
ncbi:MAG: PAS domain S-box protein [Anaerolineae bacterium]|nr:PAS domain S-box protein [Anaerolineae bacterium]